MYSFALKSQIYLKSVRKTLSEYQIENVGFAQHGAYRINTADGGITIKREVAFQLLQLFLTLADVYRGGEVITRVSALGWKLFKTDFIAKEPSRRHLDDCLADLENLGLIRRSEKRPSKNRGVRIIFTDKLLSLLKNKKKDHLSLVVDNVRCGTKDHNFSHAHDMRTVDRTKTVSSVTPKERIYNKPHARTRETRQEPIKNKPSDFTGWIHPIVFTLRVILGLVPQYIDSKRFDYSRAESYQIVKRAKKELEDIASCSSGVEWRWPAQEWQKMDHREREAIAAEQIIPYLCNPKPPSSAEQRRAAPSSDEPTPEDIARIRAQLEAKPKPPPPPELLTELDAEQLGQLKEAMHIAEQKKKEVQRLEMAYD